MEYTIYDYDIWGGIIEKHNLKNLAIELGVDKNPQKAKEMMEMFRYNFGAGKLTKKQRKFCNSLTIIIFMEQHFLDALIFVGTEHLLGGAYDYVQASMDLISSDFGSCFRGFICECEKRGIDIYNINFAEAYEIFLDVIKLKIKYKVPYTKLFVKKIIELFPECLRKEKSLEIRQYFLKRDINLLSEIKDQFL